MEGKGERERYPTKRRASENSKERFTKAFLNEQCKEIEENNRMGKIRDLFKKFRDIKGIFHAKMGTTKDRKSKDLTEAEEIKRRWQEYTKELYKKGLKDSDNHDGAVTHLKPEIYQCADQWDLVSMTKNKATGGDGNPVELFQILKDDVVKELHLIYQQIWKTQQWPQDWKRSIFIPIGLFQSQRRAKPKNVQTTIQLQSFHLLAR